MKIIVIIFILFLTGIGYFVYQKSNPPASGQAESGKITKEQAVEIVKKLPDVRGFIKDVPNAIVEVDNELGGEVKKEF